jgi:hypothetical protein
MMDEKTTVNMSETLHNKDPKSFDDSLKLAGGFGRFQIFVCITLVLAFTTGG